MNDAEYREVLGELANAAGLTGALLVHMRGQADPIWLRTAQQLQHELMRHVMGEEQRVARAIYERYKGSRRS